ncbi:MAG: hypothetical protein HFJ53_04815 [Clostridia bacterium]|jgi:hypothetical protein|nr:hypothetical protein [Clostridia bacterium]
MIKILINKFNTMEVKVKHIMKHGISFSFSVCLFSIFLLICYSFIKSPIIYEIGIAIFNLGLFLVVEFIICGIAVDTIKKQLS